MGQLDKIIPTLYAALDIVSRELVGLISAVSVNAAPRGVAVNQKVEIPMVGSATTHDIIAGAAPNNDGDPDVNNVTLTVAKSKYVPVKWTGEDAMGVAHSGTLGNIRANQFAQAMRALTNEVERDIASTYQRASRCYGTPGTTPFATSTEETAQIRKILVDNGAPTSDLQLVIDTGAGAKLRSLTLLQSVASAGTDATLRRGELLSLNGLAIRESAGINKHFAGSMGGTPLVNNLSGYAAGSSVIAFDGASAINLQAGDVVSFGSDPNKYMVREGGVVSPLTISAPGLVMPIPDNTPITVYPSYVASMAFDRSAIQAILRLPAVPEEGDQAIDRTIITDPVSGISFEVALYPGYRQMRYEIGLAWGWECIKPEHVAVLLG